MDETDCISHQVNKKVRIVEVAGRFADDKIKFHQVYIKQESYENDSLVNDMEQKPYPNINCTNNNVMDVEENSTFLENDKEDLYENLMCKNEITCEAQQITSSVPNIKDKRLVIIQYCENCHEWFDSFCIKCNMLLHILDNCTRNNDADRAKETLPKYILNIRQLDDRREGVFARRYIPKGIYFGPFDGLEPIKQMVGYSWKLKCGKFVNVENGSKVNWMHYVNCTKRRRDRNLIIFQFNGNLFYRTVREINVGDELLIYYDKQEVQLDNEMEEYCPPIIQKKMSDVFACSFCCLGFSTRRYLTKHKVNCPFVFNEVVTDKEIIRCPYCKVFLDKKEYLEFHLGYCYERHMGVCECSSKDEAKEPTSTTHMYKCRKCKYETDILHDFNKHTADHDKNRPEKFKCQKCNFETMYKASLQSHAVTHGKKPFECKKCGRKFHRKYNLRTHSCGNEKLYDCKKCDMIFRREKNLKIHCEKYCGVKHACLVCGKEYKRKRELTRHSSVHRVCEKAQTH